jgi:uncharacterized membrane protein YhdT
MLYLIQFLWQMELTLFLLAKNIVSYMTRDEIKRSQKFVILFRFSTKQFCIEIPILFATAS